MRKTPLKIFKKYFSFHNMYAILRRKVSCSRVECKTFCIPQCCRKAFILCPKTKKTTKCPECGKKGKERSKRDREGSKLPQPGNEAQPQQKNIRKYCPEHPGSSYRMLRYYGLFHAVARKQHSIGQSAAHGPPVGQDGGGQCPHAGRSDDDSGRRSPYLCLRRRSRTTSARCRYHPHKPR